MAILFLSLTLILSHVAPSHGAAFAVELINRDSPMSPLYDATATRLDRWLLAAERSHQRASHFASRRTQCPIISPVFAKSGTYLMQVSLGTPPFTILAIADTGSDLTWTNCVPCARCYEQKAPLFNPANSSSYSELPCSSPICQATSELFCDSEGDKCSYKYVYGDHSRVTGILATESFTFSTASGNNVSVEPTVFGCSHESIGKFGIDDAGLVGLGGGELSLVSQLGDSISKQFSYCLQPVNEVKSSKLVLGPDSRIPKGDMVTTPIDVQMDTFYTLRLSGVTVGNKSMSAASGSDNIIIDSGTTFTMLHKDLLEEVAAEIKKVINLPLVTDPKYQRFVACFSVNRIQIKLLEFPAVSIEFDGATVPLRPENVFVRVHDNVMCLALVPTETPNHFQIYGNIAQQGFYVAYDLGKQQLSIAPANCTDL